VGGVFHIVRKRSDSSVAIS